LFHDGVCILLGYASSLLRGLLSNLGEELVTVLVEVPHREQEDYNGDQTDDAAEESANGAQSVSAIQVLESQDDLVELLLNR
jgi:hypothetical protein